MVGNIGALISHSSNTDTEKVTKPGARSGPSGLAWWIQCEEKKNGWLVAGLIRGYSSGSLKNRTRMLDFPSLVDVLL